MSVLQSKPCRYLACPRSKRSYFENSYPRTLLYKIRQPKGMALQFKKQQKKGIKVCVLMHIGAPELNTSTLDDFRTQSSCLDNFSWQVGFRAVQLRLQWLILGKELNEIQETKICNLLKQLNPTHFSAACENLTKTHEHFCTGNLSCVCLSKLSTWNGRLGCSRNLCSRYTFTCNFLSFTLSTFQPRGKKPCT
jgi:hypothetical protein